MIGDDTTTLLFNEEAPVAPAPTPASSLLCCGKPNDGRSTTMVGAGGVRVVQHSTAIEIGELATHLETGDLLFMCGHTLMARLIEWFGRTRFSHVCMVDRVYDEATARDYFYLWESVYHADECQCVIRRRRTNGVRLTDYAERMVALFNEYDASTDVVGVAIVKLELVSDSGASVDASTNAQWRHELGSMLHAFQPSMAGRPYQLDVTALIQSRYSRMFGRAPREDATIFCSELVMLSYIAMGLLPRENTETAVSLTALSYDCYQLRMLGGARLRPQIDYYTVRRPRSLATAYRLPPPSLPPLPPPLAITFETDDSGSTNGTALDDDGGITPGQEAMLHLTMAMMAAVSTVSGGGGGAESAPATLATTTTTEARSASGVTCVKRKHHLS